MNDQRDLTGRVAVVTGGGAGIGRGIAETLAERGASVAIVERDPDRATQAREAVQSAGGRALALVADVTRVDELRSAVAQADAELGRIDILVNNAGGVRGRPFLEQDERNWQRLIDLNLTSMLVATSACAPVMIRGGRGGCIVNVASIEASRAAPTYAVYAACKAAMVSFTRSMAVELAEHQIRVNAIAPDRTQTPGISGVPPTGPVPEVLPPRSETELQHIRTYIPLGREGLTSECGELVAFLCSDAAAYITGALIPIDGGTWASSGWTRGPDDTWELAPR